jgi:hypothetical protein
MWQPEDCIEDQLAAEAHATISHYSRTGRLRPNKDGIELLTKRGPIHSHGVEALNALAAFHDPIAVAEFMAHQSLISIAYPKGE